MLGQRVTFKLKYSDQASTFNTVRHDESITGLAKVAYDGLLVVIAPGWRFGHTVPSQHVTLASPDARPQASESITYVGPNGEQHVVTFKDVGSEIDWWCSCRLCAGRPNRTREDAEGDAIRTHEVQEEIVIAPNPSGGDAR